jgi:hypothetical protein
MIVGTPTCANKAQVGTVRSVVAENATTEEN